MPETEDHFACLCEVMRYLIAGDEVEVCNLTQQQAFFARPCADLDRAPVRRARGPSAGGAVAPIGAMTRAFVQVEAQGFDLLEL